MNILDMRHAQIPPRFFLDLSQIFNISVFLSQFGVKEI